MPCLKPGDGEKTRRSKWTSLFPTSNAPWKTPLLLLSLPLHLLLLLSPGAGRVLVPVSHFLPLNHNGSPELGVLFPSCIGDPAGALKKKVKYICMLYGQNSMFFTGI